MKKKWNSTIKNIKTKNQNNNEIKHLPGRVLFCVAALVNNTIEELTATHILEHEVKLRRRVKLFHQPNNVFVVDLHSFMYV